MKVPRVALLLLAACYSPNIEDGALACSAFGECPDGYYCNAGRCYKEGSGPVGGAGGAGGRGGAGGGPQMCALPYGPFPGCAVKNTSVCDPVCQAGCNCGERCNVDGLKGTSCRAQARPFRELRETCNPKADTCRPGSICLEEAQSACEAHCYRHCRDDAECDGGRCIVPIAVDGNDTGYKACSPPAEACNPWPMPMTPTNPTPTAPCAARDRPSPAFGCYVLSARFPDVTVCDCAGTRKLGDSCDEEHDCMPGFECVKVNNEARCRRVCAVGAAGLLQGGCPAGQMCVTFTGGTKFGYCR